MGLGLDREEADNALRALVKLAQSGDEVAVLVVVACLRPGLAMAMRDGLPVDEVVSEAALLVLEFPVRRRRRVAAGLLLDVRHRFWARRKKASEELVGDSRAHLATVAAPGELGRRLVGRGAVRPGVWGVAHRGPHDRRSPSGRRHPHPR